MNIKQKDELGVQLRKLKDNIPLGIVELSKEIGIAFGTLQSVLDQENHHVRPSTIRKIKQFIEDNRNHL